MLATLGAGHESCLRLTVVGFTISAVAAGLVLILVIRYLFVLSLYLATGWWGVVVRGFSSVLVFLLLPGNTICNCKISGWDAIVVAMSD